MQKMRILLLDSQASMNDGLISRRSRRASCVGRESVSSLVSRVVWIIVIKEEAGITRWPFIPQGDDERDSSSSPSRHVCTLPIHPTGTFRTHFAKKYLTPRQRQAKTTQAGQIKATSSRWSLVQLLNLNQAKPKRSTGTPSSFPLHCRIIFHFFRFSSQKA